MARAGQFNERVTVRRRAALSDGYGNDLTGDYADVGTVWADVLERLGGEKLAGGALSETRMATVRVRKSSVSAAFAADCILVMRGETWNIRSIAEVNRDGVLLEMMVEMGVAA